MAEDHIVAVGLLTQREVDLLGAGFSRLYPVRDSPCFGDLLRVIDEADRVATQRASNSHLAEGVPNGGRGVF